LAIADQAASHGTLLQQPKVGAACQVLHLNLNCSFAFKRLVQPNLMPIEGSAAGLH
jgi:hypothetical protein